MTLAVFMRTLKTLVRRNISQSMQYAQWVHVANDTSCLHADTEDFGQTQYITVYAVRSVGS